MESISATGPTRLNVYIEYLENMHLINLILTVNNQRTLR